MFFVVSGFFFFPQRMTGEKDGTPGSDARTPEPVAVAFKERRTPLGRLMYREVEDLSDDADDAGEPTIRYHFSEDAPSGEEEEDAEEARRIAEAVAATEVTAIQANAERRVVEAAVTAEVTGMEWTEKVAAEAEEAAIEAEVVEVLKKVEARHRMPAMVHRRVP